MSDLRTRIENSRSGPSKSKLAEAMANNAQQYAEDSKIPEMEQVQDGEVVIELDPHDIDPNPYQNRRVFDEAALGELAKSIQANKQVQAIGVRKVGNRYEIIWGERRWRSIRLIPGHKIKAVVRQLDDLQMIYVCSAENGNREKIYDYEQWITVKHLLDKKEPTEKICLGIGIDQKSFYKIKKFGELPPKIVEFLEKKPQALSRNEAQDLDKIFKELSEDHKPETVVDKALELMTAYIGGNIKARGDIIKRLKAEFVTKLTRKREATNKESELKVNGSKVGTMTRTPNELRVSVSSEELPADKFGEFEKLLADFFK